MEALLGWLTWFTKVSIYLLITITGGCVSLLYFKQNMLIYPSQFPPGSRERVDKPNMYGMDNFEEFTIRSKDSVKLTGYVIKAPNATHTILYLQANAGNIGHRLPIAARLQMVLGNVNICMISYRGYGLSEGNPSEKGIKMDAESALDFILQHPDLSGTKIILFGQSIGGAVAIHLAANRGKDVHGMIVENTFTSLPRLIPSAIPPLRYFTFLCHQIWDSYSAVSLIKDTPVLLLSGSKDELVPPSHMKELHEKFLNEKTCVEFVSFENGTHNDTCLQDRYFESIQDFWKKCLKN
jgi:fermentation-respiration switch protein FrsA (DUF1100 family)